MKTSPILLRYMECNSRNVMLRKKPIFVKMGRLKDNMVTGLFGTNNLLVTKTLDLELEIMRLV